jgi:hypothetical protein
MPPHLLFPRAQVTVNGWAGILIIIILVCAALFCIGTIILICKRKRARRQRQKELMELQANPIAQSYKTPMAHEYRMVGNSSGEDVELNGPAELYGRVVEDEMVKPQQLDGYVAPATAAYDGRAVEMPAQTATR